jgi:hypothetical protein
MVKTTSRVRVVLCALILVVSAGCGSSDYVAPLWLFETLDGVGRPFVLGEEQEGPASSVAVLYGGEPHVWYFSSLGGTLRHAWFDGRKWLFETLDGDGGPEGRIDANVGVTPTAVVSAGGPHVWYYNLDNQTLRHAWFEKATWRFETLDGEGGPDGRVKAAVGTSPSAVSYGNEPHVWYYDATQQALRHAWQEGPRWKFETVDGLGGPDGRVRGNVGANSAAATLQGQKHVWYQDVTHQTLRHGWSDGSGWQFETFDGAGGDNGRVKGAVGRFVNVMTRGNQAHVWYQDVTGKTLRHAWSDSLGWHFETLDGAGGKYGQVTGPVGATPATTLYQNKAHIWYYDLARGTMRHAWQA